MGSSPILKFPIEGTSLFYPISFEDAYGPALIGTIIGALLLGIVITTTWVYFASRPNDPMPVKCITAFLCLASIGTVAADAHQAIEMTIYHPGDPAVFSRPNARPGIWIAPLLSNISAVIVQGVMAWKNIRFSRRMSVSHTTKFVAVMTVMGCLVCFGILCDLVFGLGFPILLVTWMKTLLFLMLSTASMTPALENKIDLLAIFGTGQVSCFLATDVLITLALYIELRSAKSGFAESNAMIDDLVKITFQNGIFLSFCQTGQLIAYHNTRRLWSLFFPGFIGQIYVLTLLRTFIRPRMLQHKQDKEHAAHEAQQQMIHSPRPLTVIEGTFASGDADISLSPAATSTRVVTPHSPIAGLRCRACDGTGSERRESMVVSIGRRSSEVPSAFRRNDDLMGFRAALMDLEDVKDVETFEVPSPESRKMG